jgi:ribonuclease HII
MMVDLETRYPGYGFGQHKGYGTPQHQAALASIGPSAVHRLSFAPLQRLAAGDKEQTASLHREKDP